MIKTCRRCDSQFEITKEDLKLIDKFEVGPYDLCFDCDQKRRLSFRNERNLFVRKCDGTGEKIVSIYSEDKPYKVFKSEYWYGDKWNPLDYGMPFDFKRTFFEQYRELNLKVPRIALVNLKSENSDFCNMAVGNKNCYLVFGGDFNQDCLYITLGMHNRDSMDIDYSDDNELAYMMDNSVSCYGCQFVWDSKNCNGCFFTSNCIGCTECIFCVNLRNKSYCIENKQYTKEEYLEKKKKILDGSYLQQRKNREKFLSMRDKAVTKFAHVISDENCTGDYIKNSKNCHNAFDVSYCEDVKDAIFANRSKDLFRVSLIGEGTELVFNGIAILGCQQVRFSYFVMESSNIDYSEQIISSHNLFGCNGMHAKEYCIFNKQYKKEEYFALRGKIIEHMKHTGEWGKFFPKEFSCFQYNESTAMRYFPLNRKQAEHEGFSWKVEETKSFQPQKVLIPDNIRDVQDSILQEILACGTCGKNFKVISQELSFYRKNGIPIPHMCPDCRQKERISLRNPPRLFEANCSQCGVRLVTTFDPRMKRELMCEKCFQKVIY